MSNTDSRLHVFDDTNKVWLRAVSDSSGQLKVNLSSSGLATSALQTSGNASLTSIDSKITACDTTGLATSALQTSGNSSLTSIDGKITACDTGNVSGSVSVSNTVNVKDYEVRNLGSNENVAANVTLNFGSVTSSVDVTHMKTGNLFYEDTSTSSVDEVNLEVSPDGTNWYKYLTMYPAVEIAGFRNARETGLHLEGLTAVRIKNISTTDNYSNVKCTIIGCP